MLLLYTIHLPGLSTGIGIWGNNIPVGWALRHHQLRLVDRYRSRRHADLGDPAAVASEMADVDQPFRRSDDTVRRGLRRHVSAAAHWAPVAGLLAVPLSEHDGHLAAVPQPADVGRVCGFDLRDGFAAVLVRRSDSRPRDTARPRHRSDLHKVIYGMLAMGWRGSAGTGIATKWPICCWPGCRRRWCFRCTPSCQLRLRGRRIIPGWHTTIFPPYFVAGAIYRRLRDGADAGDSAPQVLWAGRLHHACAI